MLCVMRKIYAIIIFSIMILHENVLLVVINRYFCIVQCLFKHGKWLQMPPFFVHDIILPIRFIVSHHCWASVAALCQIQSLRMTSHHLIIIRSKHLLMVPPSYPKTTLWGSTVTPYPAGQTVEPRHHWGTSTLCVAPRCQSPVPKTEPIPQVAGHRWGRVPAETAASSEIWSFPLRIRVRILSRKFCENTTLASTLCKKLKRWKDKLSGIQECSDLSVLWNS